jgi:nitrite reductase/ring-hydroxylating ferredoxin subunit
MISESTQERFKRGAADAGQFFFYIADFIDFTEEDAKTIHETRFIIEKHIPSIVADFYTQLLRFPATRVHFLHKDGTIDQEYLELRMRHQANFWRRAASGDYDEDFARYVDYVGRAHTSQGADPKIYIPERYVIGMVAFVQRRVTEALAAELTELDPDLERRASKAWNALLMVILEILSRSYSKEPETERFEPGEDIDDQAVFQLSVESYERALGMARSIEHKEVFVARAEEIPEGERFIIQVDDLSIGVFHHKGEWIALHNSCLHRGGPVCEGKLDGDTLTCPWHGYQYDVCDGHLLLDKTTSLTRYPVDVRGDEIYLHIPILERDEVEISLDSFDLPESTEEQPSTLEENEFWLDQLPPGGITQVHVEREPVAVYNLEGSFYATHDRCTHSGGPLSDGYLEGKEVICPWHDSCFDVTNGQVTCGPATESVKMYQVLIDGEKGVVKEK